MTKKNLNWQTRKLGDKKYFTILGSGIEKFEGEKEYISTSCIEMNKIIKKECKITYQKRPSRANMQPRLNSVWFARMKNTVKVYSFTNENEYEINKYILSTGFAGILCNSEVIFHKYVEKIFLSEEFNNLKDSIAGDKAIQKSLNNKDIENLEIPLPPLNVQKKIVKILDIIQEAVEIQGKMIERTKELKKSLMAELFKYGSPSFRKGRKLEKTEIGEIPENWQVVKLEDRSYFEIIMGQSPPSKFYNVEYNGFPFLQGKAEFGEISPAPKIWCSNPIKIVEKGDILISVRAPVGDVNLADQKYCIGRGLGAIRVKNGVFNLYLFYYFLLSKNRMRTIGIGSTFKAISKDILKTFPIPLPPLSEQKEIAEILKTIDEKIEIEQKKKETYEELFKTLLNKIMSQKIDVEKVEI